MHESPSDFVDARGVRLHVRRWGAPDAPTLFMLHGWMDVAASFQFVVDALGDGWQVHRARCARLRPVGVAGRASAAAGTTGSTTTSPTSTCILDHYAPHGEVNLVGHSMGANVVAPVRGRAARSECAAWSISKASGSPPPIRNAVARAHRAMARRPARAARTAQLRDARRSRRAPDPHESASRPHARARFSRSTGRRDGRRPLPPARRSGAQAARSAAVSAGRSDGGLVAGAREGAARRGGAFADARIVRGRRPARRIQDALSPRFPTGARKSSTTRGTCCITTSRSGSRR